MLWDEVISQNDAESKIISAVLICLTNKDFQKDDTFWQTLPYSYFTHIRAKTSEPSKDFDLDRAHENDVINTAFRCRYGGYETEAFYWTPLENQTAFKDFKEYFLDTLTSHLPPERALKRIDANDILMKLHRIRVLNYEEFEAHTRSTTVQSLIDTQMEIFNPNVGTIIEKTYQEGIQEARAKATAYLQHFGYPYGTGHDEYMRFLLTTMPIMKFKDLKEHDKTITIPTKKLLGLFTVTTLKPRVFNDTATYIVGRAGSGKTELIKTIFHYLRENTRNPSLVVIDPHGDLAHDLGRFGVTVAPHLARFVVNPFDIDDKSDENRELVAQEITDLIANLVDDSGLSRLMNTVSFPIITTLLKLPYADFKMFADCINPNGGAERLKAMRHLVDPHLREVWQNLEGDTYDTSKQSVFNRLQSFLNKKLIVQTLCGHDDFNAVMDEVEQGERLIISIPSPIIGDDVSETLGKFFMTRLQIWAKRRQRIPENERKPVHLFVDEFQNFLSPSTARTLDQFGRKFKLFMILAHQHIGQIDDREIRGSIMANTKNKIAGISDKATRQAVANEMRLTADQLDNVTQGSWWGRFSEDEPFKFYARRSQPKDGEKPRFYASKNAPDEYMDGWATLTPAKTQNAPHSPVITPKFDI